MLGSTLPSLGASRRYTHTLAWQRFCYVLALWPGHRSLARPLMVASQLYIRPRLAEVFRALALSHHMLRVLQRWLSQPCRRARCWRYLWQWCSFSFARENAHRSCISRVGICDQVYKPKELRTGLLKRIGELPFIGTLLDYSTSCADQTSSFKLRGVVFDGAPFGGDLFSARWVIHGVLGERGSW